MARSIFISQIRDTGNILAGLTTANLVEGSNLYFTNVRVYSNVIALLPTLAGQNITIEANGRISATTGTVSLDGLTTSNLAEGSNLYFTNARVNSFIQGNLATKANVTDLTTANVSELTNLYYTNARVYSNVIALLPTLAGQNITIEANGRITGTVSLTGLTTSNLAEGGANLYFSNARVLALIASGGTAIYRPYIATFRGNSQVTTLNLPVTPANNNFVTVIINGVTQLSNAYTLSGNIITLSGAPVTNADIDVRIVEVGQNLTKDFNSRLFYGNSVANTTLISSNFTDSSILVFENGVAQVPGVDYSVNNGLLRFTTPPASNVIVEIRELPTLNGTGTYVGGQNIQVLDKI